MLEGITAFVTGASQGIGREIATTLGDHGAAVACAARGDGIYETAETIGDDRGLAVECDVTDEAAVETAIDATVAEFGGLDCLVNNAGIAGPTAPVEEVTREEFERTLAVNVTGAFLCAKHAAGHLRESDRGSVVNISSITGKRPAASRTPYAVSKSGLNGLTRTLAMELGEDDVTVNTICPGAVRGDRIDRVIERRAEELGVPVEELRENVGEGSALGRMVEPEDVAELTAYLASERGANVTAQNVSVDAGATWY